MLQTPDRFYPIVDSVAWVDRLVRCGVRTVQLRAKELDHASAVTMIRAALAVTLPADVQLIVNDYWQAAIDAGAGHLHLGQEDLAEADLAAIRKAGLTLGVSTHDEAELETALAASPDYVALGPIWPTTLKVMRFAPQGLARISEWKRRLGPTPLIAIGGVTLERAPDVFAAGADSIAVVSDVTMNADPEARVAAWLAFTGRSA
ncbi:thiamine-phosphate pyrophosphorylase [Camelimonas lactis]|uniref:Thiamine-phosphate synthase n=1 Tax=Camelimonas lactis TaxID=659006 RepID=A0A4R2H0L1_9HYPH|nr:thiamine-phosphate pyrophosphorylase [Camelimonas lactis]